MYQSPATLLSPMLIRVSIEGCRWVVDALDGDTHEYARLEWGLPGTTPAYEALHMAQAAFRGSFVYVGSRPEELAISS
ncbi:MAG: hypothetical protein IT303_03430 [Dehalococcoidia bacterium]|nr:hypothetical protein [Dehalococcoidia bacterium]